MGNLLGGPNRRLSLSFQVDFSFFNPIQKCDYRRGFFFFVVLVVVSFLFFSSFDSGFPRWSRAGLLYVELSESGLS